MLNFIKVSKGVYRPYRTLKEKQEIEKLIKKNKAKDKKEVVDNENTSEQSDKLEE